MGKDITFIASVATFEIIEAGLHLYWKDQASDARFQKDMGMAATRLDNASKAMALAKDVRGMINAANAQDGNGMEGMTNG